MMDGILGSNSRKAHNHLCEIGGRSAIVSKTAAFAVNTRRFDSAAMFQCQSGPYFPQ